MLMLDNQIDAANALILVRTHGQQCYIGRDNDRPDRTTYIVRYWR